MCSIPAKLFQSCSVCSTAVFSGCRCESHDCLPVLGCLQRNEALNQAAQHGQLQDVRAFLAAGASPEFRGQRASIFLTLGVHTEHGSAASRCVL